MAEDEGGAKAEPSARAKTPSDFLKSIKGKPVLVKLNSGVDYRGKKRTPTPSIRYPLPSATASRLDSPRCVSLSALRSSASRTV